jgi:hypothetical protein
MFYNPERQTTLVIILNNCNYLESHMVEIVRGIYAKWRQA